MQNSEFVDEYMLIYERTMDFDLTIETRQELEDQLIQLVAQHAFRAYLEEPAAIDITI